MRGGAERGAGKPGPVEGRSRGKGRGRSVPTGTRSGWSGRRAVSVSGSSREPSPEAWEGAPGDEM